MEIKKSTIVEIQKSLFDFMTSKFESLLKSHLEDNHKFLWTEGTYKFSKSNGVSLDDKNKTLNIAVLALMGVNPKKPEYGSLEDYDLKPLTEQIAKYYSEVAKKFDKEIRCEFTNKSLHFKNPLNYKVYVEILNETKIEKVDIQPIKKANPDVVSYSSIVKASVPVEPKARVPVEPKSKSDDSLMIRMIELKITSIKEELNYYIQKLEKLKGSNELKKLETIDTPPSRPISPEMEELLEEFESTNQRWADVI